MIVIADMGSTKTDWSFTNGSTVVKNIQTRGFNPYFYSSDEIIEILNADFRRTNIDKINTPSVWGSIAADCEISFCLAQTDPNGNITSGITRTQTNETSFSMNNDPVKHTSSGGINAWPNNDYLNIWVCDLSGGVLGYAIPPSNSIGSTDGVVVGYKYFGNSNYAPYNKGRTATHEVSH